MFTEFFSIIDCQRLGKPSVSFEQSIDSAPDYTGASLADFGGEHITRFSLGQRHQGAAQPGIEHRVALPMAKRGAAFHDRRTQLDRPAAHRSSANATISSAHIPSLVAAQLTP